jgi:fatty-acyl-CoA synthase
MRQAGLIEPLQPVWGLKKLAAIRKVGVLAGPVQVLARRAPGTAAIIDESGTLSYGELDARTTALARAWQEIGLGPNSVIAILARDHRGLVEAMIASAKLGAKLLLMNTGFAGPQLADVARREGVSAVVYDQEFTDLLSELPAELPRFLCWVDEEPGDVRSIGHLIAHSGREPLPAPPSVGSIVLLTSGTTGTPKGAPRNTASPLAAAQFVERLPLRAREITMLTSPVFHATGFSQLVMAMALGSTVVLHRRFDPEKTLALLEEHRVTALVTVPTMLQRIMDLEPETLHKYDTGALRIILSSGSALPTDLGNRAVARFGEVIYNLYGSTEVAVVSIATPTDWQAAPGTVGRPPHGCTIRLYDRHGRRITEPDVRGRIFSGSTLSFDGYTGGGTKQGIDGLLATGDIGHFDTEGRLFVDGRDDDMVVSGGENVFPGEIENLLTGRADVLECAVLGVPDEQFGQRLKAFVVPVPGENLDTDTIKEYVKAHLARYKVPRDVVFLDRIPRNPTGKVRRDDLLLTGKTPHVSE